MRVVYCGFFGVVGVFGGVIQRGNLFYCPVLAMGCGIVVLSCSVLWLV